MYVIAISYKSSEADLLITIGVVQDVREFNFLLFISGWPSRYKWPGLVCMWLRFLKVTGSWRSHMVVWLSVYVTLTSYSSLDAYTPAAIVLAQYVRDLVLPPIFSPLEADIHCSDCEWSWHRQRVYRTLSLSLPFLLLPIKRVCHRCLLLHNVTSAQFSCRTAMF